MIILLNQGLEQIFDKLHLHSDFLLFKKEFLSFFESHNPDLNLSQSSSFIFMNGDFEDGGTSKFDHHIAIFSPFGR